MARRKSYQKGNAQWHYNQWTLRYYLLDYDTNEYKLKRESEALRTAQTATTRKPRFEQPKASWQTSTSRTITLGHADEIITKNIYIHISQEQASSMIEAVANKIFGENSNLLAQESKSVN